VRKWTQDYKEFLEGLIKPKEKAEAPLIVEYRDHTTDTTVQFTLELTPDKMAEAVAAGLEAKFKISNKFSTSGRRREADAALGRLPRPAPPPVRASWRRPWALHTAHHPHASCGPPPAGNMMLFDQHGAIKRYDSPEAILQEFFDLRLDYYEKRRAALLQVPRRARTPAAAQACMAPPKAPWPSTC
jgi:DNA topoisomerase-2